MDDARDWRATRHADVLAVLNDACYLVPPVSTESATSGIAWLRAHVARFCNGDDHARRRALVDGELAGCDTEAGKGGLREHAVRLTEAELDDAMPDGQIDVMTRLARRVPLRVLATRLGWPDVGRAVEAVITVAAGYAPGCGSQAERAADPAVAELVAMIGPASPEEAAANRIGLLVQACDATAGLIGNAVLAVLDSAQPHLAGASTESVLMEVLRHDPPVLVTRRVAGGPAVPGGSHVLLDLETANRDPDVFDDPDRFDPTRDQQAVLTFGAGLRPCPGSGLALALAAGVVDVIRRRCQPLRGAVSFEPSPNLRVPAQLLVRVANP